MCIPAYFRSAKAPVETRRLSRVHSLTWKPIHPIRSSNDRNRSLDRSELMRSPVSERYIFPSTRPLSLSLLFQQAAAVSRTGADVRRSTLIETNKYRRRATSTLSSLSLSPSPFLSRVGANRLTLGAGSPSTRT